MKRKLIILISLLIFITPFIFNGCEPSSGYKPCVVMLGDSFFALTGKEAESLEALSGTTYRKYYKVGAKILGGGASSIPEQYADAIAYGDIRTLILDGGGTDILIYARPKCSTLYGETLDTACFDVIQNVTMELENVFEDAVADGVENIVYQGNYYVRDGLLWQATDVFHEMMANMINRMSMLYPKVKFIHVDPRNAFPQGGGSHLMIDGIHPTEEASETMANLVWETMERNGIERWASCR